MANGPAQIPTSSSAVAKAGAAGKIPDENDSGEIKDGGGGVGNLTTPEGIFFILLGAIADIIGAIPVVGDFSDIVSGIVFGAWLWIRGSKKILFKYLLALILEAIPIVEDVAPIVSILGMMCNVKMPTSWIGLVYCALSEPKG